MRNLGTFLPALLFCSLSFAHDVCDRETIQKAIREAKVSTKAKKYAGLSKEKVPRPARQNLQTIFKKVESSVFGRKTLRIQEDLPIIPPMASINDEGIISISPQTLDSLNQKLTKPPHGAAFIIAHEIGHLVQDVSFERSSKALSPHGLKRVTDQDSEEAYNHLHAETDCIAIEIYHQAGYPITEDIFKTLDVIKNDCKTQKPAAFCEAADQIRKSTVQSYIQKHYKSAGSKADAEPANSYVRPRSRGKAAQ